MFLLIVWSFLYPKWIPVFAGMTQNIVIVIPYFVSFLKPLSGSCVNNILPLKTLVKHASFISKQSTTASNSSLSPRTCFGVTSYPIKFSNKLNTVIGPTPPGTGEIFSTILETSLKSTSPSINSPVEVIPTSITVCPFDT
jgi:hypothetical protein